jgi:hypothetical protein
MTSGTFLKRCPLRAAVLVAVCVSASPLFAQGPALGLPAPLPDAPSPLVQPISQTVDLTAIPTEHKFWDKPNCALFAAATALNGADLAVTYANLRSGGRELNPVVRIFGRSAPGLAINFGGETAGIMGLSYFLHKTGHHKLERMVSIANIGASAGAVGYGLAHR